MMLGGGSDPTGFASVFVGLCAVFAYVVAFELLWSIFCEDSSGDPDS